MTCSSLSDLWFSLSKIDSLDASSRLQTPDLLLLAAERIMEKVSDMRQDRPGLVGPGQCCRSRLGAACACTADPGLAHYRLQHFECDSEAAQRGAFIRRLPPVIHFGSKLQLVMMKAKNGGRGKRQHAPHVTRICGDWLMWRCYNSIDVLQ